jgi:hypothetical protein
MYNNPGNKQNTSHNVVIGPVIEKGFESDFEVCTGHFKRNYVVILNTVEYCYQKPKYSQTKA